MMKGNAMDFGSILHLRWVRVAFVVIPLCMMGISLIFYLKPRMGRGISGLAVLTASIQAMAALSVVLFFTALRQYLKYKEARRVVAKSILSEEDLLKGAFRLGRFSSVDTAPNPEHQPDWSENVRMAITADLLDFLEEHPIQANLLVPILDQCEKGLKELLSSDRKGKEDEFSLPLDGILKLVGPIFRDMRRDPEILKLLQVSPSISRESERVVSASR
ncbi:MAG: hypothetical protein ACYCRD_11145 [Leptospirillum sp.]